MTGPEGRAPDGAAGADGGLTCDGLLGGRVRLLQPRRGYRAGTDPVFLAAAVPARPGERVLDLGCGTGAAALCLAARVPGLDLHGLELLPAHAALARANGAANGAALTVHEGDVADPPAPLSRLAFDHAMANPPHFPRAATAAADAGRDAAQREGTAPLSAWIAAGLRRLRPGGSLTLILRAEQVPEALGALLPGAGAVALLPLAARTGRPALRALLQGRKGRRGPFRLLAPLVLHEGPAHPGDHPHETEAARRILRDGDSLLLNAEAKGARAELAD